MTLQRADGLMADAHRDLQLAEKWGLRKSVSTLFVPGGGGIDLKAKQAAVGEDIPLPVDLPPDVPVVINPRGFRPGSVRSDTFQGGFPGLKEIPERSSCVRVWPVNRGFGLDSTIGMKNQSD